MADRTIAKYEEPRTTAGIFSLRIERSASGKPDVLAIIELDGQERGLCIRPGCARILRANYRMARK